MAIMSELDPCPLGFSKCAPTGASVPWPGWSLWPSFPSAPSLFQFLEPAKLNAASGPLYSSLLPEKLLPQSLTADSSLSLSRCSVLLGEASPDLRESGSFTSLRHSVTSPVACSFSHYHGLTLSYTCLYPPEEHKFCESQDLSVRFTTVYFAPCT